jgi:hypothetical protein
VIPQGNPNKGTPRKGHKGQNIYNKAAKATKRYSLHDGKLGFEFPVRNFFAVLVVLLGNQFFVFDLDDDAL